MPLCHAAKQHWLGQRVFVNVRVLIFHSTTFFTTRHKYPQQQKTMLLQDESAPIFFLFLFIDRQLGSATRIFF
jgi:hypothetical protein